ncbi:hypothetical protein COCON_G00101160 [Conger conger]|uniref:Beta-1,4-galactosyltransferase n=1 Tax=Conger conger TaxID=82655 RepID=A0A9Q1HZC6_CONCO|nr:beta-1,4-galactosyltransferase 1-like [Conger conger]XP_061100748.1 beta-1,4-galactosyltransferase 1-like [Conger conger]KAJ8271257.1 hypothetical protein COCON_G00101160 [Conger conger]
MGESTLNFSLLHRTCSLVVVLCILHLSVTLFYYLRTLNNKELSFVQNQQTQIKNSTVAPEVIPKTTLSSAVKNASDIPLIVTEKAKVLPVLPKCPDQGPTLVGPLRVEFTSPVSLELVRDQNPRVQNGGRFKPDDCVAQQKVAMIIPFRHREEHLKYWLHYLHPILQRQQLDYGVYVINQFGEDTFNRAKLLNVGYAEALKEYDYECFVFSDVDLIPMDDRNIYKCYSQPRHLSVSMDKFGFKLPYLQYFGGVSSMSKQQFLKINGFPNNYWGWGGEDDDIFNRLSARGMSISRPSGDLGKCRMIRHNRDAKNEANPQRFNRITHTRQTMDHDGINTLTYKVVNVEKDQLFTKITVDVGKPDR